MSIVSSDHEVNMMFLQHIKLWTPDVQLMTMTLASCDLKLLIVCLHYLNI